MIAVGGAILAVVIAIAVSPIFPIGIARRAEVVARRRGRRRTVVPRRRLPRRRSSSSSGWLAANRTTRAASYAIGIGRATRGAPPPSSAPAPVSSHRSRTDSAWRSSRSGRQRIAGPIRAARRACSALLGVSAALVFASSLGHLETTPHLYGWSWNFKAPDDTFSNRCDSNDFGLTKIEWRRRRRGRRVTPRCRSTAGRRAGGDSLRYAAPSSRRLCADMRRADPRDVALGAADAARHSTRRSATGAGARVWSAPSSIASSGKLCFRK